MTKQRLMYFAYGSNLDLDRMLSRCPFAEPVTQALAYGYRLAFRANKMGYGVATIVPAENRKMYGALYEITSRDLQMLDMFEGYPSSYTHQFIPVEAKGLGLITAITYIKDTRAKAAPPLTTYLKYIYRGYNDWNLPTGELIRCIGSIQDRIVRIV